jgi:putative membrane protein insertion efficiency factor
LPCRPNASSRAFAAALALAIAFGAVRAAQSGETPATPRESAAGAIQFYQAYLSDLRHGHCRFEPSCSQYAADAIRRYGVIEGTSRAADRLMRCNAAAGAFYARTAEGRMLDPVDGERAERIQPLVPRWLLSAPAAPPPADSAAGRERVRESIAFARSLADEGDCYRAATEYKRAAYLAGDPADHAWAHERIGTCFFHAGEWTLAESEFLSAGMLAQDADSRRGASLMAAACRFDAGDYRGCEAILGEAGLEGGRELGLSGLGAMARGDWAAASERLARGASASDAAPIAPALRSLGARVAEGRALPRKSAALARTLSFIVPGTGQMYAGRAQDGLRHLLFNGALIWTIAELARDRHYAGAYVVAGIEAPFFAGNVIGAGSGAKAFNRSRRAAFVAEAVRRAE